MHQKKNLPQSKLLKTSLLRVFHFPLSLSLHCVFPFSILWFWPTCDSLPCGYYIWKLCKVERCMWLNFRCKILHRNTSKKKKKNRLIVICWYFLSFILRTGGAFKFFSKTKITVMFLGNEKHHAGNPQVYRFETKDI